MLKALRNYWAFTNETYKWIMLVALPIMMVIANLWLIQKDFYSGLECLMVLYIIDTIADHLFMGGVYKKGNSALGFLQSSPRFAEVFRDITIVDIVRRVLTYQIPYVVTSIYLAGNQQTVLWCDMLAFSRWMVIFVAQVVILIARHEEEINMAAGWTFVGTILLLFMSIGCIIFDTFAPVATDIVLVGVVVLMAVISVRYTDKKVRESYYD